MLKYEFERVRSTMEGFGLINGTVYGSADYQEIIKNRVLDGWRFVGTIPATQRATGHIEEMDLVFEKEENLERGNRISTLILRK